ncbi:MAG: hypothetical protein VB997_03805, partial [Opitutales bacterium]
FPNKLDGDGSPTRLVVLQSTIREKLTSRATKAWLGYSTLEETYLEGTLEIVGNVFDGRRLGGIGIDLNGTATHASIHNNQIHRFDDYSATGQDATESRIGIRISGGAKADVLNNSISFNYGWKDSWTYTNCGMGIYVKATAKTTIFGNLFYDNYCKGTTNGTGNAHVRAPAQNVSVAYNAMLQHNVTNHALVAGGVENHAFITETGHDWPHFLVDPAGFMNNKAGKDKGQPDAIYLDHDGSRNDIGPNGGRNYLPNGRATNKPVPISFTAAPLAVPAGGIITIQSTGATVK